jgi:signal transduction histidine kinase
VRLCFVLVTLSAFALAFARSASAGSLPRSVVIVESANPGLPFDAAMASAMRSTLGAAPGGHISIYAEYLDFNAFSDAKYEVIRRNYFREKYLGQPIGAIITIGFPALQFMLRFHASLWPGAPVVFSAIEESALRGVNLPRDVTGTLTDLSLQRMLDAARRIVPNFRQIVMVGEPWDRSSLHHSFKDELLPAGMAVVDLKGKSLADMRNRVASLPNDAVILYTGIVADDAGTSYVSTEALASLAQVANRPIVIDLDHYLGNGAVGGYLLGAAPVGTEAAGIAMRLLDGESAASVPVTKGDFIKPVFDWRQVQRWNVSNDRLPPESELRFRSPGLWDQYRLQVMALIGAMSVLIALIAWLLFERYRRRTAELESRRRLLEVIHLNRAASAGVLSASIAHELSQPLGAILNNAEAAVLLLGADTPDVEQVKEILADICADDKRAADVILHLRELMKRRNEIELRDCDLNEAIHVALHILEPEFARRGVIPTVNESFCTLSVRADQVLLQQVFLNLVVNGMDAMVDLPAVRRKITIQTALIDDSSVEVSILDSGTGIPAGKIHNIFETFYTTKRHGTGLGLSITRTIVESCGGRIWAENRCDGGAVFRFTLPLAKLHSADQRNTITAAQASGR